MTPDKRWPSDWVRAVLPTCILQAVAGSEAYGYQIIQALKAAGFDGLSGGTLYPALMKLEQEGWITSEWGFSDNNRRARYYQITAAGRRALGAELESWRRFAAGLEAVLRTT